MSAIAILSCTHTRAVGLAGCVRTTMSTTTTTTAQPPRHKLQAPLLRFAVCGFPHGTNFLFWAFVPDPDQTTLGPSDFFLLLLFRLLPACTSCIECIVCTVCAACPVCNMHVLCVTFVTSAPFSELYSKVLKHFPNNCPTIVQTFLNTCFYIWLVSFLVSFFWVDNPAWSVSDPVEKMNSASVAILAQT